LPEGPERRASARNGGGRRRSKAGGASSRRRSTRPRSSRAPAQPRPAPDPHDHHRRVWLIVSMLVTILSGEKRQALRVDAGGNVLRTKS